MGIHRQSDTRRFAVVISALLLLPASRGIAQIDLDGDGLRDLNEVRGFRADERDYNMRGIQDLDGASEITSPELFLGSNRISSIEPGDFDGLSNLERLTLSRNKITTIQPSGFVGLNNLEQLNLEWNRITSIELGSLNGLSNLKLLTLRRNAISSIEVGDLGGLNNLESLHLDENAITNIEPGSFDGLNNLESLYLDENAISSIDPGDLRGLGNLKGLYLRRNRITSIDPGGFDGISNLESLYLYGNAITSIAPGDLVRLSNLKRLDLGHNAIASIEPNDFAGLSELRYLDLHGNQFTSIDPGDFDEVRNLIQLDLSRNQITSIEAGDFFGLNNLQTLDLQANVIANIEDRAFTGLSSLETLHLGIVDSLETLNLTGATFEALHGCRDNGDDAYFGLCVGTENQNAASISQLVLDDSVQSAASFDGIIRTLVRGASSFHSGDGPRPSTSRLADVSLVGLTFSDAPPEDLNVLLEGAPFGATMLNSITVDEAFLDEFRDELTAFSAKEGNNLIVVPGLCDVNRNGTCDVNDIDALGQASPVSSGRFERLSMLVKRPQPHGFHTSFGDANLDGEFNSRDLVEVFVAGEYEDGIVGGSGWADGDWNGDGDFTTADLVVAFEDGGFERGPRVDVQNVPEPSTSLLLLFFLTAMRRLCTNHLRVST